MRTSLPGCSAGLPGAASGTPLPPWAVLSRADASAGFDGRCPAANPRFPAPGTQDASLPAPDGPSQHTIALLLIILTSVIQAQALFHLSPLAEHIKMKHPQKSPLSRCCSAMEIPAFLHILQVLPPLHSSLMFLFIYHRQTAKSSACLPVKSSNSCIVGVQETSAQQQRSCACWVKLASLLGILGIILFQYVASFSQPKVVGERIYCSNSGVNML